MWLKRWHACISVSGCLFFMNICSISVTSGTEKRMLELVSSLPYIYLSFSLHTNLNILGEIERNREMAPSPSLLLSLSLWQQWQFHFLFSERSSVHKQHIQRIHMLFAPCLMTIAKNSPLKSSPKPRAIENKMRKKCNSGTNRTVR